MAGSGSRKPVAPMVFPSQIARQGPGVQPEESGRPGERVLQITAGRPKSGEPPRVYVFRQARVVVGRSSACDLRLEDPERVSSSRHAEIRLERGRAFVADLGSRNCTAVNGDRLEPEVAVEIGPGDSITISDSELRVAVVGGAADRGDEKTITAEAVVNPFAEETGRLAETLYGIAEMFDQQPPERRREELAAALEEALGQGEPSPALLEIARVLARTSDDS